MSGAEKLVILPAPAALAVPDVISETAQNTASADTNRARRTDEPLIRPLLAPDRAGRGPADGRYYVSSADYFGVNAHGMRLMPWMKLLCRYAGSPVISMSGRRVSNSSNITLISRRAK